MDYDERILAGAAFLDANSGIPNWRNEIDVDRLMMDNAELCILGQLFGDYHRGITQLNIWQHYSSDGELLSRTLGFSTNPWDSANWEKLDYEWKRYLEGTRS